MDSLCLKHLPGMCALEWAWGVGGCRAQWKALPLSVRSEATIVARGALTAAPALRKEVLRRLRLQEAERQQRLDAQAHVRREDERRAAKKQRLRKKEEQRDAEQDQQLIGKSQRHPAEADQQEEKEQSHAEAGEHHPGTETRSSVAEAEQRIEAGHKQRPRAEEGQRSDVQGEAYVEAEGGCQLLPGQELSVTDGGATPRCWFFCLGSPNSGCDSIYEHVRSNSATLIYDQTDVTGIPWPHHKAATSHPLLSDLQPGPAG